MDQSETFRQLANCYRNTVHCSCYYSSYAHQTSNMDILMKYATIISDTIDGPNTLSLLKEDGYIKWASYLTLSSYQDAKQQTLKLVHQLVAQENHKAIARIFEMLRIDYPVLCSMIPEISCGQRYSLCLGHNDFLKVMTDDGEVTVKIMKMAIVASIVAKTDK